MNNNTTNKSERIASKILRLLAVIGLIASIILVTWVTIKGIGSLSGTGGNITAAISNIRGIFQKAPIESLIFELDNRTFAVGETSVISWQYIGENTVNEYDFSYECGSNVKLDIMTKTGWTELTCGTKAKVMSDSIKIIPTNNISRFADIKLTIEAKELVDSTVVSIVNADISSIYTEINIDTKLDDAKNNTEVENNTGTENNKNDLDSPKPSATSTNDPVIVQKNIEPLYKGDSDLVVNIKETGVLVDVSGESTFFPVSPVPSDKVAAVKFTITNRGGLNSGAWVFKAELPIEDDSDYKYTSPIQTSLKPGMQVEYTLGFDELLQDDSGKITIQVIPTSKTDKTSNNTDVAIIEIFEK